MQSPPLSNLTFSVLVHAAEISSGCTSRPSVMIANRSSYASIKSSPYSRPARLSLLITISACPIGMLRSSSSCRGVMRQRWPLIKNRSLRLFAFCFENALIRRQTVISRVAFEISGLYPRNVPHRHRFNIDLAPVQVVSCSAAQCRFRQKVFFLRPLNLRIFYYHLYLHHSYMKA